MDIVKLNTNQLIDCFCLVQITIAEHNGLWANKEDTVILASGATCLKNDAHEIDGKYYHLVEFEEYEIVYDHYRERYEFSFNCFHGHISNVELGYFSMNAEYLQYGGDLYISHSVAAMFNIYYCCDCDREYRSNYGCDCSVCCFDYHNISRADWSNNSQYKIGLEIEKEDLILKHKESARNLLHRTGWIKERDSSLDNESGFELVSPILPLALEVPIMQQEQLYQSINVIVDYLGAKYSDTCGGHINISKVNTTSSQLLKEISGYLPLFYAMYADRLTNEYSEAESLINYIENSRKYYAFNCKNRNILELRIFPAVENINNLIWRIELIRLILAKPTTDYKRVLLFIVSPRSLLNKHMRWIFSNEQLINLVKEFCIYLEEYDNVVIGEKVQERVTKILKVA